jgi:hypothetical protein
MPTQPAVFAAPLTAVQVSRYRPGLRRGSFRCTVPGPAARTIPVRVRHGWQPDLEKLITALRTGNSISH